MKIAIVGKGKTGQAVVDILGTDNISEIFDSKNIVTSEKLDKADIAIIFVDRDTLINIMPILLNTATPIVCGTTGFEYSKEFIENINISKKTWVVANNFSLSMVFIKETLESLGKIKDLIPNAQYSIEETHHTQKLDAPSGTAVSWQQWANVDECPISSIRAGDVKGIHDLSIDYEYESLQFKHIAHDRKLFAQGAVWTAKYIIQHPNTKGFHQFETLVRGAINGY
jgi:4-hydroxy-tetrahydrodipicolinate reductase